MDEHAVKEGVEYTIDGVVNQAVAHTRFVDVPWLGVVDFEVCVAAVAVGFVLKLPMQLSDLIYQVTLEL